MEKDKKNKQPKQYKIVLVLGIIVVLLLTMYIVKLTNNYNALIDLYVSCLSA